jgi:hypothetical protein
MAESAFTTAGAALLIVVLGVLIRFGRMGFLIAGVGVDDSPPGPLVSLVGDYTILVGLATGGLAVASWTGTATPRLWDAYAVVVGATAVTLPLWAKSYARLTV